MLLTSVVRRDRNSSVKHCTKCKKEHTCSTKMCEECKEYGRNAARRHYSSHGAAYHAARYRKYTYNKYGLEPSDFKKILASQNGECATCPAVQEEKTFHLDHNHVTGKVRGILCPSCNLILGHAKDSPDRLRALADYLEKST